MHVSWVCGRSLRTWRKEKPYPLPRKALATQPTSYGMVQVLGAPELSPHWFYKLRLPHRESLILTHHGCHPSKNVGEIIFTSWITHKHYEGERLRKCLCSLSKFFCPAETLRSWQILLTIVLSKVWHGWLKAKHFGQCGVMSWWCLALGGP